MLNAWKRIAYLNMHKRENISVAREIQTCTSLRTYTNPSFCDGHGNFQVSYQQEDFEIIRYIPRSQVRCSAIQKGLLTMTVTAGTKRSWVEITVGISVLLLCFRNDF
jgi:hypothetical protein